MLRAVLHQNHLVGDMGKSRQPSFIFFANTRYAWSASTCVAYVFSRFIHIFKYLSELTSFNAAYHCRFFDVCRHTMARFLPLSPVTPLICFMQADFSSVTSSEGACLGDSSSVEPSDDELLVILEKKLERTGVAGTLFVADLEGVFLDDGTLFDDSVLETLGLDEDSFSFSLSFDEELFDVFVLGDLGGSVFDRESLGGALSGNAPIGVAGLEDEDFEAVGFEVAGFGEDTFGAVGLGAAAGFGDGGFAAAAFDGAALGMVTFGGGWLICAAGGCAVNWPLAICLARSFTLRNILTDSDGKLRSSLGAIHRFNRNRQPWRFGQHAPTSPRPEVC
ncbi:hypothetical protein BDU57DRAFT_519962 [Ampelomyces quisqualis]|uniref:Uncharacterized protein n=1 Tax=Ampelomyces quisqualis TaxID=50730 RepID=A0A6A5QIW8_AMPQU|nr:hypothetical protein BDU57DRAFT_519962 [Ampelomyces quisqualis]